MIQSIAIKNIALIEDIFISFYDGLNVITGETGTGKSLIINAFSMILGGRLYPELLRTGCSYGSVECVINIKNNLKLKSILNQYSIPYEDDSLIIKRELTLERNRAFINLNSVTSSVLKEIGQNIIDLSSQHQYQSLLRTKTHIELLDNFANLNKEKRSFYTLFYELKNLKEELFNLEQEDNDKQHSLELNMYAISEIENANLTIDEDNLIADELDKLNNIEMLTNSISQSYHLIYKNDNSVLHMIEQALHSIEKAHKIDSSSEEISKALKELQEVFYLTESVKDNLLKYSEAIFEEPSHKIEELNERLNLIQDLKRKYGGSIDNILKHKQSCLELVEKHSNNKKRIEELKHSISSTEKELATLAINISKTRQKSAKRIEKAISDELRFLGMNKTVFKVEFRYVKDENSFLQINDNYILVNSNGIDYVEFIFSANPGEEPKSLNKIASGGELSRVTLAIKTILTDMDNIDTLLFDEVDAGLGGETASKIADKVKSIAQKRQVICITHSPQIGSQSQHHYFINKFEEDGRTKTQIKELTPKEKVLEIARMLSGDNITDLSVAHAKQLIEKQ